MWLQGVRSAPEACRAQIVPLPSLNTSYQIINRSMALGKESPGRVILRVAPQLSRLEEWADSETNPILDFPQQALYFSRRKESEGSSGPATLLLWARFLLQSFLGGLQVEHKSRKGLNELVRREICQQYLLPSRYYGDCMWVAGD